MNIYYVEDEKQLSDLLVKYLEMEGYLVKAFYDGESAMPYINDSNVNLWVLDINLPGRINGYDLLKKIKAENENIPVLFTSARNEDVDKVYGLEIGSDDYLAKPFSPRELLLRINKLLNRKEKQKEEIIEYFEYEINLTRKIVKEKDEEIILTYKEFQLLEYLLRRKNQEIKREELLYSIWGKDYEQNSRVVDDLLRRLRNKLPKLKVETIYGLGYKIL